MNPVPQSAKERIIVAAERLLAERGPDVAMREISAASGGRNHTAVQYHFGSKDQLIRAIFQYRHRERAAASGVDVLPFAVHASDILDGLVGFLEAPVSGRALAALETAKIRKPASPLL